MRRAALYFAAWLGGVIATFVAFIAMQVLVSLIFGTDSSAEWNFAMFGAMAAIVIAPFAGTGLAVAVYAHLSDRDNASGRCRKCGYDLRGSPGGHAPGLPRRS